MSSVCNNETIKRLIHCHVYEGTRICSFITFQHYCSTANKVGSAEGSEEIMRGATALVGILAPQLDHSLASTDSIQNVVRIVSPGRQGLE
jgi:hypothetical protein